MEDKKLINGEELDDEDLDNVAGGFVVNNSKVKNPVKSIKNPLSGKSLEKDTADTKSLTKSMTKSLTKRL